MQARPTSLHKRQDDGLEHFPTRHGTQLLSVKFPGTERTFQACSGWQQALAGDQTLAEAIRISAINVQAWLKKALMA